LAQKWNALEVEMIEYLKSAIYSFDDTRKLSEDEHKNAFVDIFINILLCIKCWCKDARYLYISSNSEIKFEDVSCTTVSSIVSKKSYCYCFSFDRIDSFVDVLAAKIYFSNNDSIVVSIPDYDLEMEVAMDPIYFAITKAECSAQNDVFLP
jgi:hypothetical protein